MLALLKTLEEKLSKLIAHANALRAENQNLRRENTDLREQHKALTERMTQAQGHIDSVISQLEHAEPTTTSPQ
jgi:uncharacterized protein (TIGR02449 family)